VLVLVAAAVPASSAVRNSSNTAMHTSVHLPFCSSSAAYYAAYRALPATLWQSAWRQHLEYRDLMLHPCTSHVESSNDVI
jgi:hypothetical protein